MAPLTAMRPPSGARAPASTCIRVDLPAPLWPTRPTHSPAEAKKSTPSSARTAPKCFSAPSSLTMIGAASGGTDDSRQADDPRARTDRDHYFMLALIASIASACVYSLVAT